MAKNHEPTDDKDAVWVIAWRIGLEEAACRIEELGGRLGLPINPTMAAREIRALKDK